MSKCGAWYAQEGNEGICTNIDVVRLLLKKRIYTLA